MMDRAMTARCLTGLIAVTGCSHAGIASIGVVAPEGMASGGFVKKPINCACCCVRVKVAIIIPRPMPQITHSEADRKNNTRLPRIGTPKANRATTSANPISKASRRKIGATFAMISSELPAGVMSNCSIVPSSFSRTSDAEDTTEPCNTNNKPIMPVVINQELLRPGL